MTVVGSGVVHMFDTTGRIVSTTGMASTKWGCLIWVNGTMPD